MTYTDRIHGAEQPVQLVVAVVAEWLPTFAPPVGDNGFAVPYTERLKVALRVDATETLASVRRRVVDEVAPVATGPDGYAEGDPYDAIHWCMFYEPEDDDGIDSGGRYEFAEDLITVDASGLAHWHRGAEQIRYGDLVRAGERGLLRGDPRRPYVVLLYPQGDHAVQTAWEIFLAAWAIFGHLLAAREGIHLARATAQALRGRLAGVEVVERRADEWGARGAGPADIIRTVELQPWAVDDLRILLGLESVAETVALLSLLGMTQTTDGTYVLGVGDEAKVLAIAAHDAAQVSLPFADPDASAEQLREAFAALLDGWSRGEVPQ